MKLPGLTPPTSADGDALDARALLTSVNKRQAKIILAQAGVIAAMAFAISAILPLKSVEILVMDYNKASGELAVPRQQEVSKFVPGQDTVLFFIRRWISAELTINPFEAKKNESIVLNMLRGSVAISKHETFRKCDPTLARLANEPTLTREVSIDSISEVPGSSQAFVANVTLTTTSRGAPIAEKKLLTIYHKTFPPTTKTDRMNQPIGLYIVDFNGFVDSNTCKP